MSTCVATAAVRGLSFCQLAPRYSRGRESVPAFFRDKRHGFSQFPFSVLLHQAFAFQFEILLSSCAQEDMIFQITTLFVTDIGFDYIAPDPTGDDLTSFFETVVLLSKGEIDSKKVRVEFSLENMDMSGFQKGATYPQIKEYVQEHSGLTSICETVQRPAGRYQCPVSNRQSDIQKRMSLFFFVCCKLVSPAQRLSGYPVIYFWGSL